MGKGDQRTKRGKTYRGTFGVSRPKPGKVRKEAAARAGKEKAQGAKTGRQESGQKQKG